MLSVALCLALSSGIAHPQTTPADRTSSPAGVSVSGRLLTEDGRPFLAGTVVMSRARSQPDEEVAGDATVRPDGSFTFHGVAPGHYELRAQARTGRDGGVLFGTFALSVRSRDVTHVDLMLQPGATVRGELHVQARHGSTPPVREALRVRAPLSDGSSFGDGYGAAVGRDGAFTLESVVRGTHVLVVQGLVFPWRISEATVLGHDAVERAFDVEPGREIRGVRIALADIGAGVSGTVTAPAGIHLADVLVVAFPADPLQRALPLRFVRVGRPAENGAYRIVDLAAGRYRVIAAAHATEQDALDPVILERWMTASTPVTLAEAHVSTVPSLVAIPAAGAASVP